MRDIFLCSISNVSSGNCPEDCAYCTQSIHYKARVPTYRFKPIETIVREAQILKNFGVLGFCLVTSGRGISTDDDLSSEKCEYIAKAAHEIKSAGLSMHLIACCGRADRESLVHLKNHGIDSYNHNLETAQSFFPQICSTHSWEERFLTCQIVNSVGLALCTGGIFGLGENFSQRLQFLREIQDLRPKSVPINFYIDNSALPIREPRLTKSEAISCVMLARDFLPHAKLMIAGGREVIFSGDERLLFDAGIDAIVLGDYLTTPGADPENDLKNLQNYGLKIAQSIDAYGLNIVDGCE